MILRALRAGLGFVARNAGLVALLWLVNVGFAASLAAPLAASLEGELEETDAANNMMYGFDHSWWEEWAERQTGWRRSLSPAILGLGFAFDHLARLLDGQLPMRLMARGDTGGLDGALLALGTLYLLLHVFLTGGVLAVIRAPAGVWTARGLLHGAGFYFGRLLRVAALALLAAWLVLRIAGPLSAWAEEQALEAVSETTASAWLLGHHLALLLALLLVWLLSSYAKLIVVLEQRESAALAWLSAVSFCASHPLRTAGHALAVAALALASLAVWGAVDARWQTVGFRTQLVWLVMAQLFVAWRLALRLGLWAGQAEIYRALTRGVAPADRV